MDQGLKLSHPLPEQFNPPRKLSHLTCDRLQLPRSRLRMDSRHLRANEGAAPLPSHHETFVSEYPQGTTNGVPGDPVPLSQVSHGWQLRTRGKLTAANC
jgi:hypothetical protein